jgi:DNA-binding FadR family transcriptional regulator
LVYDSEIWRRPDTKDAMDRHRRQLIRALEARDPDRAELQMRQYILEAREMLIPPGDERAEPGAVDTVEG